MFSNKGIFSRGGVVGSILSLYPGGLSSIPDGVMDFNLDPVLSLEEAWHSASRRFKETVFVLF